MTYSQTDYLAAALMAQGCDDAEAAQLAADYIEQAQGEADAERARLAFDAFGYGCAKRWAVSIGHPLREVWGGVVSEWVAVDDGEGFDPLEVL